MIKIDKSIIRTMVSICYAFKDLDLDDIECRNKLLKVSYDAGGLHEYLATEYRKEL